MQELQDFTGFPTPTQATPVPEVFFAEILPRLTNLAEIKIFLIALRRIRNRKGAIRTVTAVELSDAPELGALTESAEGYSLESRQDRLDIVRRVMSESVESSIFLEVSLSDGDVAYFVNDSEGRRAFERVRAGDATLAVGPTRTDTEAPPPKPGEIFRLYEDTIGPIPGAGIAEELSEAEQEFPAELIREAFKEAAAQNARSWAYVRAVLRKWKDRGRGDGTTQRGPAKDRYRGGQYGQIVRWR